MEQVNMIGIDLAKNSFQLHGARADGSVAFRKKLSRAKLLDFVAARSHAARWRWRHAMERTIGAGRSAVSAMRCDWSRWDETELDKITLSTIEPSRQGAENRE